MAKIASVIAYEGDNRTFVWKYGTYKDGDVYRVKPEAEDFNALTQLIVHESQEAVFFMNGQALDLFGPGRHTLETQNIPLIGRLLRRTVGDDRSPFHCEVYYVNKTVQMAVKWGTDSKVEYTDPIYGFPISLGASGEMSLRAQDSRKLLLKLVGTELMLDQQKLVSYFRAFLMTRVKTYIPQVIRAKAINVFDIDANLSDFSEDLRKLLIPDFEEYGIALERFLVTNVAKPDGDRQYDKFKELHYRQYTEVAEAKLRQQTSIIEAQTEAQKLVIDSQAQAQKRAQEGYSYAQERGFDVAEKIAQNEAVGQFTSMGVGLGTMAGVGGTIGGVVGGAVGTAFQSAGGTTTNPVGVGAVAAPGAAGAADDMAAFKAKLDKLTMMKEAGILSDEELAAMKAKLLSEI
ncbi:MAG: SPFH domain-containing protein [Lachnospiraceae bacterium]|nr:SPFH domain-containing protein [Lachnospiraceae bacterium]